MELMEGTILILFIWVEVTNLQTPSPDIVRPSYLVISLPGAALRVKCFWQSDPIMKNMPETQGMTGARALRSRLDYQRAATVRAKFSTDNRAHAADAKEAFVALRFKGSREGTAILVKKKLRIPNTQGWEAFPPQHITSLVYDAMQ